MVLQANKTIHIFGNGEGEVTVEFLGQKRTVLTKGEWLIELDPQPYGGPYTMDVTLDGEKTTISDIWLGDVYLLGGQSNMQFKMIERREPTDVYEDN